ncbi:MAG: DsrE family protein [Desulfobacteraceae bacterium]|nr:DsrE family protein [Desulfobacteraceae bacterium]
MRVAYIFSTGDAHYLLSNMIVPQLEKGAHGFEVAGMFFFLDNTFMLVKGNDVGERLASLARKNGMLLMACDKCAYERKIYDNLVEGAALGCFPDLHKALGGAGIDQVITL